MRTYSKFERYGYPFAFFCIAVSTSLFVLGRDYFAKGQWALLYLLIIGLVAGLSGVRPALLTALLAFLSWNYFLLPPYHTFRIGDPKDWLALFVFLVVGVAAGVLTGRMRAREAEAHARELEMGFLNKFSASLVSKTSVSDMADALIREVRRATRASCVNLFLPDRSGKLHGVPEPSDSCAYDESVREAVEWVYKESKALGLPGRSAGEEIGGASRPVSVDFENAGFSPGRRDLFIPLQTVSRLEGVLYVGARDDGAGVSQRDAQLMLVLANQAAAFLERKSLQAVAVQADAIREADKLKSTLVSSVSHELKTPLASVTATVSNLLEQDIEWDASHAREELEAVQDDLQRLNGSIGALLDLSRLESAAWEPKKSRYEFGEILGTALSKTPRKQQARVSFSLPDDLPALDVDFQQWTRVLQNLLDNALAYSPPESPVQVGAAVDQFEIRMWVEDQGPGVPPEDKERIFEKFYRSQTATRVPTGTGLGLAVTREIVRFHGGKIWVEDVLPLGARIVISLPRESV